jgi:hypothetical protein
LALACHAPYHERIHVPHHAHTAMKLRIAHRETRLRATSFAARRWSMRCAGAHGVDGAPHPLH